MMNNLDVKYLRGERDAKPMESGRFVKSGSLMILVDGENSGEVFRTQEDGYQGSTFKQLSISKAVREDYLLMVIESHRKSLKENKVGSAIPHLNKKIFREIEVYLPPYNEQMLIVAAYQNSEDYLNTIMGSL